MGKKNMDALLSNIMGDAIARTTEQSSQIVLVSAPKSVETPLPNKENTTDDPWKHFSFICSIELADKVQAIAHKEGFTIRALMEYMMRQGISTYEAKHGKVKKIKAKGVTDVM